MLREDPQTLVFMPELEKTYLSEFKKELSLGTNPEEDFSVTSKIYDQSQITCL
ncbi:hypothetical protein K7432_007734 [Basidiobolus ranarum]|uniref:Uncharacterized protein n=1 Tax=Basidiobolus ranarum TaxID=34480 RepID=A0ABR2WSX6_9FUNG